MLFAAKRSAHASIALAVAITAIAISGREAAGLTWSLQPRPPLVLLGILGFLGMLLADAGGHLVLAAVVTDGYLAVYAAFIESFDGQSRGAVLAAGLLAASEELLFRGVVLHGLLELTAVPVGIAVGLSGLLFGLAHFGPGGDVRLFTIWAVWEGVLLGVLFVVTGSLVVVVVAHGFHDIVGFGLLAWQRDHGIITATGIHPAGEP